MARKFNGTADYLKNAGVIISAAPITVCAWVKPVSVTKTTDQHVLVLQDAEVDNGFRFWIEGTNATHRGKSRWAAKDAGGLGNAKSPIVMTAGVWQHMAAVEISNSSRAVYFNGANKGVDTETRNPAGLTKSVIGACEPSGGAIDLFEGDIGHVAVWNAALSDKEILSLAKGVSPLCLHIDNLIYYSPLNGQSPELDVVNKLNMTLNGTPSKSEEPPMSHPIKAPGSY